MPFFADQMKDLTEHLRGSIENRTDSLQQVHHATENLLGAARSFMADVTQEHHEMARELQATLTEFHDDLSDKVDEMRERHRTSLADQKADMRHRLDENAAARREAVETMRNAFQQARFEVATDLRAAGATWREFAATRDGHRPMKGEPEPVPKATAPEMAKHDGHEASPKKTKGPRAAKSRG